MHEDDNKPVFVTVAGPRDYTDNEFVINILDGLLSNIVTKHNRRVHIIEGGASGVDAIAKQYALQRRVNFTEVKADWKQYGRSAGPRRNGKMAEMSDYCIVFYKGTKGSASMIAEALKKKVPVYVISISTRVGVGKKFMISNLEDWEYIKECF